MKVKCINNNGIEILLTVGKIYNVIKIDNDGDYGIINDLGSNCWFFKEYFKPLSEIRNERIDKLLK